MRTIKIPYMNQMEMAAWKVVLLMSAVWSTIAALVDTYMFSEWDFLPYLVVLVIVDTLTGVWKSLLQRNFNSYTFGAFITKAVLYAVYMVVLHGLTNFSDRKAVVALFEWVQELGYAALIVRESISIIENLGAIKPGLVPRWILKRLKNFDETGKPIK